MEDPLGSVGPSDDADWEEAERGHESSPEEGAVEVAEERGAKDNRRKVEDKDAGNIPGAHACNNAKDLAEAAALGLRLLLLLLGAVIDDRARQHTGVQELSDARRNGRAQQKLQRSLFRGTMKDKVHGHRGTESAACQCRGKNTVSLHVVMAEITRERQSVRPRRDKSEKKRSQE